MFDELIERGFQVEFTSHSRAIMGVDFPTAVSELQSALKDATIPIEEIIAGGGGESKGTQRLRRALAALGWKKTNFKVQKIINGEERESQTHEIDHVKKFPGGARVALEIEWNNKDPFFDRDLENFKRLHADGAISVGIIVTRGTTLQDNMRKLVNRFMQERQIASFADIGRWGYDPTAKQRAAINAVVHRAKTPLSFREAFTNKFVSDKFGQATTHWKKLEDRIHRGVGNPCPLVFIGLPDTIVTFDEGHSALIEVEAAEAESDAE